MNVPLLDLKAQYADLRDEIQSAMHEVVESQYFIMGPKVQALESRVTELQTVVARNYLRQTSPNERVQGAWLIGELSAANPGNQEELFGLLRHDPNPHVRLAALEGLSRSAGHPAVREELFKSLPLQESSLVRMGILQILVQRCDAEEITGYFDKMEATGFDARLLKRLRESRFPKI